ncbi:MAG: hypothetical protein WC640_00235 [Candidatus Paceibacterota bacterium]|jgi:hypothetical protein
MAKIDPYTGEIRRAWEVWMAKGHPGRPAMSLEALRTTILSQYGSAYLQTRGNRFDQTKDREIDGTIGAILEETVRQGDFDDKGFKSLIAKLQARVFDRITGRAPVDEAPPRRPDCFPSEESSGEQDGDSRSSVSESSGKWPLGQPPEGELARPDPRRDDGSDGEEPPDGYLF